MLIPLFLINTTTYVKILSGEKEGSQEMTRALSAPSDNKSISEE